MFLYTEWEKKWREEKNTPLQASLPGCIDNRRQRIEEGPERQGFPDFTHAAMTICLDNTSSQLRLNPERDSSIHPKSKSFSGKPLTNQHQTPSAKPLLPLHFTLHAPSPPQSLGHWARPGLRPGMRFAELGQEASFISWAGCFGIFGVGLEAFIEFGLQYSALRVLG